MQVCISMLIGCPLFIFCIKAQTVTVTINKIMKVCCFSGEDHWRVHCNFHPMMVASLQNVKHVLMYLFLAGKMLTKKVLMDTHRSSKAKLDEFRKRGCWVLLLAEGEGKAKTTLQSLLVKQIFYLLC